MGLQALFTKRHQRNRYNGNVHLQNKRAMLGSLILLTNPSYGFVSTIKVKTTNLPSLPSWPTRTKFGRNVRGIAFL